VSAESLDKSVLLSNVRCSALGPHLPWGSPVDTARRGLGALAPRAPGPLGKISRGRLKSLQRRMSSLEALRRRLGADPCYAPLAARAPSSGPAAEH